jgi:hypothetical protein
MSNAWLQPKRPKGGPISLGRPKQPRWHEGRRLAAEPRQKPASDCFDWVPGERVDGLPRRREADLDPATLVRRHRSE